MSISVAAPTFLIKQPSETRAYSMDFSNLMASAETITNINSVGSELRGRGVSDLTITGTGITGQTIKMNIAGGTHAKVYVIETLITTSSGQILEGDGMLKVEDR